MFLYIYVAIYIIFWNIIINLIYYLKTSEDQRKLELQHEFNINIFQLSEKETEIVKYYLTKNDMLDKNIIFSFKDNIKSITLLNVLNKLGLSKKVHIIYVTNNIDDDTVQLIEMLNELYGFEYNISTINDKEPHLDNDYKNYLNHELKSLYLEYSKMLNTDIVLHTSDQNSMCNEMLSNLFTNNIDIISDISKYQNYTIYRPLFNLDIESQIDSSDVKDRFVEIIDTYKHHYPNWKNNLQNQLMLLTKEFNNNTISQLDKTIDYYKNGFVLNLYDINIIDDKYCQSELRYLYSKAFQYYNIMIYNTTMNKMLSLSKEKSCVKHDNWIFILDNHRVIGMDYKNCQDFINSCEEQEEGDFSWETSKTNNSLVSFLNEDFFEYYYIDTLNENVNTFENVFYENDIFNTILLRDFSFEVKEKGTYHIIDNK